MSTGVIKTEQLDAERSLAVIRMELEKLHRLSPHNLPKSRLTAIVSQLPTAQDVLAPAPASTATANAFATIRFIKRALIFTFLKLFWVIILGLALIGGTTVGLGAIAYMAAKLPWEVSFMNDPRWQTYSDGFHWGKPQDAYTRTAEAIIKTNAPELDSREL
ncbi:hypothetical protein TWF730_002871 [Orbilia blumenaviensis]|uniref:Uncharacterized protein n=1 Tax=Orbilia blumenaviensis TaxID=1796055 RepID=A0AAV9U8Y1_9PEZI